MSVSRRRVSQWSIVNGQWSTLLDSYLLAGAYAVTFDIVFALEFSHGGVVALGNLAEVVPLLYSDFTLAATSAFAILGVAAMSAIA